MTLCTDKHVGNLLHPYELGILDEDEQQRFEAHLLNCDYCFSRLETLLPAALLLRSAPEIVGAAREAVEMAGQVEKPHKSVITRIFSSPLARYAAAAAVLIVISVPLLQRSLFKGGPVQEIYLSPLRGTDAATVDLETGGPVALSFVVTGASEDSQCEVAIYGLTADTLFYDASFTAFNEAGRAIVELETSVFKPGIYTLSTANCDRSAEAGRQLHFMAR